MLSVKSELQTNTQELEDNVNFLMNENLILKLKLNRLITSQDGPSLKHQTIHDNQCPSDLSFPAQGFQTAEPLSLNPLISNPKISQKEMFHHTGQDETTECPTDNLMELESQPHVPLFILQGILRLIRTMTLLSSILPRYHKLLGPMIHKPLVFHLANLNQS